MIDSGARTFGQLLRRLVPLATVLLAVVLDLLPLPNTAPQSLSPFFTVCVFAYWALFSPGLMSPVATFAVGLLIDAAGGLPLGLTSLALLVARSALFTGQRFLIAQPFPVLWGCFVATALAVELVRWLVASGYWGRLLPLQPVLFQACLTIAFYPVANALLSRLRQHVIGPAYAARG
jgi:rod shape-determining protein MreD